MKKFLCCGWVAIVLLGAGGGRAADSGTAFAEALARAKEGDDNAMIEVAQAYESGTGTAKNLAAAFEWYKKAADEGSGGAALAGADAVAQMFERGEGTKRDPLWALHYYLQEGPDTSAAVAAAQRLVKADPKLASQLRTIASQHAQDSLAAAEKGDLEGKYDLAQLLMGDGGGLMPDFEAGLKMMEQVAEKGYGHAQSWMGDAYGETDVQPSRPNGQRIFALDPAKSLAWFKKAAAQGHPRAAYIMAGAYESGEGVEKDFKEAYRLYGIAIAGEVEYASGSRDHLAAEHPEVVPGYVAPAPAPTATPQPAAPVLTPLEKLAQARADFEKACTAARDAEARYGAARTLAVVYADNYEAAGLSKEDATRSVYAVVSPRVRERRDEVGGYMYALNSRYLDWQLLCNLVVNDIGFPAMNTGLSNRDQELALLNNRATAEAGDAAAQYALAHLYLSEGKFRNEDLGIAWLLKALAGGNKSGIDEAKQLGTKKYQEGLKAQQARNYAEAVRLFELAVQLGVNDGAATLGTAAEFGWVQGKPDFAKAMEWYRLAAEHGNTDAMVAQGELYARGQGVAKDEARAVQLFRQAAEKGDDGGILALGYAYLVGRGVPADEAQAKAWIKRSADKKVAPAVQWMKVLEPKASPADRAQLVLLTAGKTLGEGAGEIFLDPEELLNYAVFLGDPEARAIAAKWRPIDHFPDQPAEMTAAFAAEKKRDFPGAYALFKRAAEKGHPLAMKIAAEYNLGASEVGMPENLDEASRWYERAGEAGMLSGWIGAYVVRGFRIHQAGNQAEAAGRYPEALKLWRQAADMGQPNALATLGSVYEDGFHGLVKADLNEARRYFEREALFAEEGTREMKRIDARLVGRDVYLAGQAAEEKGDAAAALLAYEKAIGLGNTDAMEWMAYKYQVGKGVPLDRAKTVALYQRAKAAGSTAAAEALDLLKAGEDSEKLRASLVEAQKLADIADGKVKPVIAPPAPAAAAGAARGPADEHFGKFESLAHFGPSAEALNALRQALAVAETGSPMTRYRLSAVLFQGTFGLPRDEKRGHALLVSAANDGSTLAQLGQAQAMLTGSLGFSPDPKKGLQLLITVIDRAETHDPETQYQAGLILFRGAYGVPVDRARGLRLIEAAAGWDVPQAAADYGQILLAGMPPEVAPDAARGVELLKKAAAKNISGTYVLIGQAYERGQGVPANQELALRWYRKADEAGVAGAREAIARLTGKPVPAPAVKPAPAAGTGK